MKPRRGSETCRPSREGVGGDNTREGDFGALVLLVGQNPAAKGNGEWSRFCVGKLTW